MNSISPDSGFSLLELIIVALIIAILVVLAIPQFKKSQLHLTRQNAAQELKTFLDRARFDSIKRRAKTPDQMASVTLDNPYSFTLLSDLNSDGQVQINEVRHVSFESNPNIKMTGNNLVFPITINFNYRGRVTVTDGNDTQITPTFIFCEQNCTTQTANTENAITVTISKAGTSSVTKGYYTPPSINSPNISTVQTDAKIKQSVTVSNTVYAD